MKKKSVYDKIKEEQEDINKEKMSNTNTYIKAMFSQRIFAFLIDLVLISMITSLITLFVPVNDTATKLYEEQNRVLEDYIDGSVSMEEYVNQMVDLSYDVSRQTVIVSIVTIVVTLLYYVVYPCYNNGQSFGKKLMKIRIKKVNDSDLSMNDLLVRGMINNSIFVNIINVIFVLFLSKNIFLGASSLVSSVQYLVLIISLIMIAFTKNARGLHDLAAKTEVVQVDTVKEDVLCTSEN